MTVTAATNMNDVYIMITIVVCVTIGWCFYWWATTRND